jgi:hypothetical protein
VLDFSIWDVLLEKLDLKFLRDGVKLLPTHHQRLVLQKLQETLKVPISVQKLLSKPGLLFQPGILDYQTAAVHADSQWPLVAEPFTSAARMNRPVSVPLIETGRQEFSIKLNLEQFATFTELLLSFHAFLKYGGEQFQSAAVQKRYQDSFCQLMSTLTVGLQREGSPNGWKLQKFLECCHFGKDHSIFGPPVSHNTDTGERGLKQWAKPPAATAQNRSDKIFKGQVVRNLLETDILNKIVTSRNFMHPPSQQILQEVPNLCSPGGSTYTYHYRNGSFGVFGSGPKKKGATVTPLPKQVSDWFVTTFSSIASQDFFIQIFTEITIGSKQTGNQELLRAHPNFRREGPWYDFVDIDYGLDGVFPARVACFFQWPDSTSITPSLVGLDDSDCSAGQVIVLIHEAEAELDSNSILYSKYKLQGALDPLSNRQTTKPIFKCVYPESINGRVYAIDTTPQIGGIFWKPRIGVTGKPGKPPPPFHIIKIKDRQSVWPQEFLGVRERD